MRVMAIRLPHVCRTVARGKVYFHIRLPGRPAVRLYSAPNTPAFAKEYEDAMKALGHGATIEPPAPGTLGHLIGQYKASDRWTDLSDATRVSYDRAAACLKPYQATELKHFTRARILKIRDTDIRPEHGRWMANYVVTYMGVLLAFALDHGIVEANPLAERVRKIRAPKDAPIANRPWTPQERATVLGAAPAHLRLVLALAMTTGLRKADLLTVTLAAIKDGEIEVRTSKRGRMVRAPVHPLLIEALNSRPQSDAVQIAVTRDGNPWTADGFDTVWQRFKTKLEKDGAIAPGLTIHGLRHTLGHMLHEAGATDRDIADILGHAGTAMARHYSANAAMPEAAKERVRKLQIVSKKG